MIIRRGRIKDASAIAEVHIKTWQTSYAGLLPDSFIINLSNAKYQEHHWRQVLTSSIESHYVYVAEDLYAGVVGFCSGGSMRGHADVYDGEVYTLYLLDSFQGMGIGKSLFLELVGRLHREGKKRLLIWVLADNPTRFFYESLGGKAVFTRDGRVGGKVIHEIGYGWLNTYKLIKRYTVNKTNIQNLDK